MRLIDADALKKALEVTQYNDIDDLTRTERLIDNAPTVDTYTEDDVENAIKGYEVGYEMAKAKFKRPTGEWINQSQGAKYPCECSECHTEPFCNDDGYVLSNFCPNCGAEMGIKEETDNEQ